VEQDGSGNYSVIQDAVIASTPGDTILIGPGRYNEGQVVECPGWTEYVRVLITQSDLTLIGSGDSTIIGPEEPWDLGQGEHIGLVGGEYWGCDSIVVSNILFENMGRGVYVDNVSSQISNCTFRNNYKSITNYEGTNSRIEECVFDKVERNGLHLFCSNQYDVVVRACEFVLLNFHEWNQQHLSFSGVFDGMIDDCIFSEGSGGVTVSLGSSSTVLSCSFDGQSNFAMVSGPGSSVIADNCIFRNQSQVTRLYSSDSVLKIYNSVVEDVEDCTLYISYADTVIFRDCDLAKGSRGVVWVQDRTSCGDLEVLDMTGNYWGTDDPDSIQAWIRDNNDSEQACFIVDYEPYLSESTPVEAKSMSDLKSLFR